MDAEPVLAPTRTESTCRARLLDYVTDVFAIGALVDRDGRIGLTEPLGDDLPVGINPHQCKNMAENLRDALLRIHELIELLDRRTDTDGETCHERRRPRNPRQSDRRAGGR